MKEIKCPKDIGFVNAFSGNECELKQFYGDCFHCWSSSIAAMKHKEIYDALIELTKTGVYLDSSGNVCNIDQLFTKIYSDEALKILKRNN